MIGIFDSGSGGLTVLSEIRKLLPEADIVYYGDFKNSPYGNKTPEELGVLTVLGIQRLISLGATQIVTACNSASASIIKPMFDLPGIKPVDVIEMVGPTARAFGGRKDARLLLVGTVATVRSGIYQDSFRNLGLNITALSLPNLAGAIEEGTSIPGIKGMVGNSLGNIISDYDVVILGCTHYPLIKDIFEEVVGDVEIFDPAKEVAKEAERRFESNGEGKLKFVISRDSEFFRGKVSEFFGDKATIEVLR